MGLIFQRLENMPTREIWLNLLSKPSRRAGTAFLCGMLYFMRISLTYPMTVNQVTGELLTPEDIREIVAYVKTHRVQSDPFDVAVNGETPADPEKGAEIVQPYIEAGATWWVELIGAYRGSFEEMRERIQNGPPRM